MTRDKLIYAFSETASPVVTVDPGESLCIETEDCFSGAIRDESRVVGPHLDIPGFNPATGPIGVRGARPGDVLCVSIESISLDRQGVTTLAPGFGVLGEQVMEATTRVTALGRSRASFLGRFRLPIRKMVGVIGVAPVGPPIDCATPGNHGGNLDTAAIGEGSRVFLPIFVREGLLALGDVHAAMADGEICGTGIETRAEVTVTISLSDEEGITCPMVETDDAWLVIQSDTTVEAAARRAASAAASFLQRRLRISFADAYMLLSLVGDHRVSQLVNPLVTVHVRIPRYVFSM